MATQVSAALSEWLLFRGGGGNCRDSQLLKVLRKSDWGGCSVINRASTPTVTRLKKHCTRAGGKTTYPKDGEDYCKMLSSGAAWLLCYHSQSTKDGVPQHSCTGGGKGLMMTASP